MDFFVKTTLQNRSLSAFMSTHLREQPPIFETFSPSRKKKILRVFEQSELSLPLPIQFLTLCQHQGTSGSSQDSSLLCSEDGAEKYTLRREIKGLKITCFLAFEQQQNEIFFCKKRKVQLRYKQQHWEILNGNNLPFTGF